MKSLEEIIKQEPMIMNDWKHKVDVIGDFEGIDLNNEEYTAEEPPYANVEYWLEKKRDMKEAIERWKDINILFASYSQTSYSGDAWVLFERNGTLYEASGSHCSCYGLEGQWMPEEVVLAEIENRLLKGSFGEDDWSENNFKEKLCEFLDVQFIKNS